MKRETPSSVTFRDAPTAIPYDAAGRLVGAGSRAYDFAPAGHLSTAREGGKIVADYNYDSTGTRVRSVDRTGRRAITRHDVTGTLEWDETRAMVWTHVRLGGRAINMFAPAPDLCTAIGNPPLERLWISSLPRRSRCRPRALGCGS